MSDFDDAVGDMVTDLLVEAGVSATYLRGTTSTTMTLRMSRQQPEYAETSDSHSIEVQVVDFIGLTTAFPYDPPKSGDKIKVGSEVFELLPDQDERCFRVISPQMMRVHTKQVK